MDRPAGPIKVRGRRPHHGLRTPAPSLRTGFAIAYVGALIGLLGIVAFSLWFMTSSTLGNLAKAAAGQAYMDVALSALAESLITLQTSIEKGESIAGLDIRKALTDEFPFDPIELDPALTRKLAQRVSPGVTVSNVTIRPVGRSPPGDEDPLIGAVDMVATVRGKLGGYSGGREVRYRFPFTVPCTYVELPADTSTYVRIHWGTPHFYPRPIATMVKHL